MMAQDNTLAQLVDELRDIDLACRGIFRRHIFQVSHAETVEEVMEIKQQLLLDLLRCLPLGYSSCYFCLERMGQSDDICEGCEYGEVHGRCPEAGSDYDLILRARDALYEAIFTRYYRGERYGDCKKEEE